MRRPAFKCPRVRNIWCVALAASRPSVTSAQLSFARTGQTPVLVRDLAEVRESAAIKRGDGSHNAKPAVIIGIQKQPGANTLELTDRIDATLAEIQQALPAGMQIQTDLFRSADFIQQALDNLFTALLEGAALVTLVIIVFLMNVRAAAITLVALPFSLIAAAVAMDRFGFTLNTMSLGGLAIAIGELVDDAIIDVGTFTPIAAECGAARWATAAHARRRLPRGRRFGRRWSLRPSSWRSSSCRCSCLAASRAVCCARSVLLTSSR